MPVKLTAAVGEPAITDWLGTVLTPGAALILPLTVTFTLVALAEVTVMIPEIFPEAEADDRT
jgi:hypothetical protein